MKNHNTTFEFADAVVVGKSSSNSHRTLTINKGSLHGLKEGMVVITGQGLVGRISEVGLTTSNVLCITDISSSVGALVERSAMVGIAEGYYGNGCRFLYTTGFSSADDIAVGDVIISSGNGSVYPYGLKIGKVSAINIDDASRSIIATIEMAVDFEDIDRVMIIKSFTVE